MYRTLICGGAVWGTGNSTAPTNLAATYYLVISPSGPGSPRRAREEKMLCWIAISNTLVC
jgi:hypothetical protein